MTYCLSNDEYYNSSKDLIFIEVQKKLRKLI